MRGECVANERQFVCMTVSTHPQHAHVNNVGVNVTCVYRAYRPVEACTCMPTSITQASQTQCSRCASGHGAYVKVQSFIACCIAHEVRSHAYQYKSRLDVSLPMQGNNATYSSGGGLGFAYGNGNYFLVSRCRFTNNWAARVSIRIMQYVHQRCLRVVGLQVACKWLRLFSAKYNVHM